MKKEVAAIAIVVVAIAGTVSGFIVGFSSPSITYRTTTESTTLTAFVTSTSYVATSSTATSSESTSTTCNSFVGCEPVDVPVLLNAFVNQSSAVQNCGVTLGFPEAAVCQLTLSAGVSGTVVLNLTSQNGDSMVAFGTYSSEGQYVTFASSYPCQYSSSPPDYNTLRCPISRDGSVYGFGYTVSQSLTSQTEATLTIVVTKTCCWP